MEDREIVNLYWRREEQAITETASKYGSRLSKIAFNILYSREDAGECVNDTYMKAWNSIPPNDPHSLLCFLGRITRNLSLNMLEAKSALKRGKGQVYAALEELEECIPSGDSVEETADENALIGILNRFLSELPQKARTVFVKKYWYMDSVKEIAASTGLTESNVKGILMRTREKLKKVLAEEGVSV